MQFQQRISKTENCSKEIMINSIYCFCVMTVHFISFPPGSGIGFRAFEMQAQYLSPSAGGCGDSCGSIPGASLCRILFRLKRPVGELYGETFGTKAVICCDDIPDYSGTCHCLTFVCGVSVLCNGPWASRPGVTMVWFRASSFRMHLRFSLGI